MTLTRCFQKLLTNCSMANILSMYGPVDEGCVMCCALYHDMLNDAFKYGLL